MPCSIIVSPVDFWSFSYPPRPLPSPGSSQFPFFLPEAPFLLFISWPAPTSDLSLNVTSSWKPSERELGASWCPETSPSVCPQHSTPNYVSLVSPWGRGPVFSSFTWWWFRRGSAPFTTLGGREKVNGVGGRTGRQSSDPPRCPLGARSKGI